jgi:hypothetical protein
MAIEVFATSWMPRLQSVPAMVKRPSLNSTSSSAASRKWAASFLPLATILLAHHDDGASAHGGRARATGAHTKGDRIGVALDEFHLLGIDTEPVHQPSKIEPVNERHSAERVDADFGGFDGRIGGELMPRSMPRLAASLRRASKPFQSASFMVRSRFSSNRPLS